MPPKRKHLSGCEKRKRRKFLEELIASRRGSMDKFVVKESGNPSLEDLGNEKEKENKGNELHECLGVGNDAGKGVKEIGGNESGDGLGCQSITSDAIVAYEERSSSIPFDIFDPRNWENLDPKLKNELVEKGPIRDLLRGKGPKDGSNRRFCSDSYTRILPNGEYSDRDWLVYSKALDKAFCFCCKVFKKRPQPSQLANEGCCKWRHLSGRLKEHETSPEHVKHYASWSELRTRLLKGTAIDHAIEDQLKKEQASSSPKENNDNELHQGLSVDIYVEENVKEIEGSDSGDGLGCQNINSYAIVVYAETSSSIPLDIFDPRNWENLDGKLKDQLVEKGPKRDLLRGKGPKDGLNRRFSSDFYTQILPNGEEHHRDWLVYSEALDKAFCFCCKLFKKRSQPSHLASEGYCNWNNFSGRLKEHETSIEHVNCYASWFELRGRLLKGTAIDHAIQDQIKKAETACSTQGNENSK